MKKIIILFTILMSVSSFAQRGFISVSAGADIKHTFAGSKPTNNRPSADILLKFSAVGIKGAEATAGFEYFPQINFSKYTIGAGYNFPLYGYIGNKHIRTNVFVGLEPTIINRWSNWGGGISWNQNNSFLSLGANAGVRWFFNDHLGIEYQINALPRTDLSAMYGSVNTNRIKVGDAPVVLSQYFSVVYKFDRI